LDLVGASNVRLDYIPKSTRTYGDSIMSGPRDPDDDNDGFTVYDDDGEDITKGLPDDDYNRPTPSDIPNKHGEYNF